MPHVHATCCTASSLLLLIAFKTLPAREKPSKNSPRCLSNAIIHLPLFKLCFKSKELWCIPLILELGRQRQADLWTWEEFELRRELQERQDYTEKCFLQQKQQHKDPFFQSPIYVFVSSKCVQNPIIKPCQILSCNYDEHTHTHTHLYCVSYYSS